MTTNTNRGLSNKTALIMLAIGYPIGIILSSVVYISYQKDTFWDSVSAKRELKDKPIDLKIASDLLASWWNSRSSVFGPPYDPSKVKKYIADGPYWKDISSPNGPIAWLKKNNQYYIYRKTEIVNVVSFETNLEKPKMVAVIDSSTVLMGEGINDNKENIITMEYTFTYEDKRWKIWDMQQVKK